MLRTGLLYFQMRVHAWWIRPGPVSQLSFSSLAICTNAARSFIHVLLIYHQRPNFVMMPHMIVGPIPVIISPLSDFLIARSVSECSITPHQYLETDLDEFRFGPWKGFSWSSCMHECHELIWGKVSDGRTMRMKHFYDSFSRFEMPGRFRCAFDWDSGFWIVDTSCRDVLQAIMSASQIPSLSRQNFLKRTRDGESQETHEEHSAPFAMPSGPLSFEIPPAIPLPSIAPFEPPYMGLSSSEEASNPGMSDYKCVPSSAKI